MLEEFKGAGPSNVSGSLTASPELTDAGNIRADVSNILYLRRLPQ